MGPQMRTWVGHAFQFCGLPQPIVVSLDAAPALGGNAVVVHCALEQTHAARSAWKCPYQCPYQYVEVEVPVRRPGSPLQVPATEHD